MNYKKKRILIFIVIILVTLVSCYITFKNNEFINGHVTKRLLLYDNEYDDFKRMDEKYNLGSEASKIIQEHFIEPVDKLSYIDGGIYGMIKSIGDDDITYLSKNMVKYYFDYDRGNNINVGFSVYEKDGRLLVKDVSRSELKDEYGIKRNTEIRKINGKSIDVSPITTFYSSLQSRGESPSVELKIENDNKEIEYVTLSLNRVRDILNPVSYSIIDNTNIGYIDVNNIIKSTPDEFERAVMDLEASQVDSLIIDFRDLDDFLGASQYSQEENLGRLGGVLLGNSKISIASGKDSEVEEFFGMGEKTNLPYIILINENTKSIGEQITYAAKNYGLAYEVVGETTSGKGALDRFAYIQNGGGLLFPDKLVNGFDGGEIRAVGVTPTIEVELDNKYVGIGLDYMDNQLEKAIDLLKGVK